jgi:cell division protein FtsW (lipid II flippase)
MKVTDVLLLTHGIGISVYTAAKLATQRNGHHSKNNKVHDKKIHFYNRTSVWAALAVGLGSVVLWKIAHK